MMYNFLKLIYNLYRNKTAIRELGFFNFVILKRDKKFNKRFCRFKNTKLQTIDSSTFISLINEIFGEEIYKFNSDSLKPVILDCGSNIGLATIYFKLKFPNSIIECFEPDPNIFNALEFNVKSFRFNDIVLNNSAISDTNGTVTFLGDGGLSGMISTDNRSTISVPSVRLADIMDKYAVIDFLKIDIEGHEEVVIFDISNQLNKVNHLFLEYHSFLNKPQILDKILELLTSKGFRYYIKESEFKKDPFITREIFMNMDTVVNIFCYRN